MTFVEYTLLGIFSAFVGSLLSILASWALAKYFFEIKFHLAWFSILLICLMVIVLTTGVGWLNSRSVLNRSPLEVLRKEV